MNPAPARLLIALCVAGAALSAARFIGGTGWYVSALAGWAGKSAYSVLIFQSLYALGALVWSAGVLTLLYPWEQLLVLRFSGSGACVPGGIWGFWKQLFHLVKKENARPASRDRLVFAAVPVLFAAAAVTALGAAPRLFNPAEQSGNGGLFLLCGAGLLPGLLAAAGNWSAQTKHGVRLANAGLTGVFVMAVPLLLSVLPLAMLAGGDSASALARAQNGGILRWFFFTPVAGQLAFLLFLLSSAGLMGLRPLGSGDTALTPEYSGSNYALMQAGRCAQLAFFSALCGALFFGAGAAPFEAARVLPGWFWFTVKLFMCAGLYLWLDGSFAPAGRRNLARLVFKFIAPLAALNLVGTGAYLCLR
ncbi:MAG: NADH-quinone oxidoreductase subunit H [Elusimicrobiaceae bacterium]|nr:NADH-quinone oxidoreductase subunit H [Elusimicrobiaceae bacterium]